MKFLMLVLEMVSATLKQIMKTVTLMVEIVVMTGQNSKMVLAKSEIVVLMDLLLSSLEMVIVMMKPISKNAYTMDWIVDKLVEPLKLTQLFVLFVKNIVQRVCFNCQLPLS